MKGRRGTLLCKQQQVDNQEGGWGFCDGGASTEGAYNNLLIAMQTMTIQK